MRRNDKALIDYAYDILRERYASVKDADPITFMQLCRDICERANISEEDFAKEVSSFYTDLTLDGRFVIRENNTWSLKEYEKYENIHIDMNDVYELDNLSDGVEEEEDEEEDDDIDVPLSDDDDEEFPDIDAAISRTISAVDDADE